MENNQLSPNPGIEIVEDTLTFPQAIAEIIKGNRITRLSWNNENEYGLLADGWLTIHTKGNFHVWKVSDGDLEGTDWIAIGVKN